MAVLRSLDGKHEFSLETGRTIIGRDLSCDIVVNNGQVSRRHAAIDRTPAGYTLEDLNSHNGTFVNDVRISEPLRLSDGDRVGIFDVQFTFCHSGEDSLGPTGGMDTLSPDEQPLVLSSYDASTGADLRFEVKPEAKLRAVLEISRQLGNTLNPSEVLPRILDSLLSIFPQADRGVILQREPETGNLVARAARFREHEESDGPAFSRSIVNYAMETRKAILSGDAANDPRFEPGRSIERMRIRSIMCVPMVSRTGDILGVIHIATKDRGTRFSQEDLDVLVSASSQAARAVELANLHLERRDLEAAAQIQRNFLPGNRPHAPGLRFFDYYSSALHVGGDYYDYIPLDGRRLAITVGDVAGKGVSAALLMARLSTAARFSLTSEFPLPEAVNRLNTLLTQSAGGDWFATFLGLVVDFEEFTATLVNAGHLPPLLRRAGTTEVTAIGDDRIGLPLAVFERPYESTTFPLEPGDALVLYTDGITEARNPAGDFYGAERLQAIVAQAQGDIEALGHELLADVEHFAGNRPPSDDRTLVCIERGA